MYHKKTMWFSVLYCQFSYLSWQGKVAANTIQLLHCTNCLFYTFCRIPCFLNLFYNWSTLITIALFPSFFSHTIYISENSSLVHNQLIMERFPFLDKARYYLFYFYSDIWTQPAFTCSKLVIETLEQGVKYVQS